MPATPASSAHTARSSFDVFALSVGWQSCNAVANVRTVAASTAWLGVNVPSDEIAASTAATGDG